MTVASDLVVGRSQGLGAGFERFGAGVAGSYTKPLALSCG